MFMSRSPLRQPDRTLKGGTSMWLMIHPDIALSPILTLAIIAALLLPCYILCLRSQSHIFIFVEATWQSK